MMKLEFFPLKPFADVTAVNWLNPHWQMRNCLQSVEDFAQRFNLSDEERQAFEDIKALFRIRVTPYYAKLANPQDPMDPIRRILMPHSLENLQKGQQMLDPLGEDRYRPVQRIIHRYPDRVLFLITDFCSVYCRYCTRKHFTGQDQIFPNSQKYEQAIQYIGANPAIREVILSGGDPLTLSNSRLEQVLNDLRRIDHVEIIRIGSRMLTVCPMRITSHLVRILKKAAPIFFLSHFNHPRELTAEAAQALGLLVDNGIPVMNQMVLLNGVNNHPAIVQALSRRLLYLRAKPYYMFQCDPSEGTSHLQTSVDQSLEIQKELWGRLSGLALPNFSLDIPGGGGKVGLVPHFEVKRQGAARNYRGWDGLESTYVSPDLTEMLTPSDTGLYIAEWNAICQAPYGKSPKRGKKTMSLNSQIHGLKEKVISTAEAYWGFVPPTVKDTLKMNAYSLLKTPMIAFLSPRVVDFSENKMEIKIPLNYRSRNHLGFFYFGALAVGANTVISGLAMRHIQECFEDIQLIFKDFRAEDLKKAEGDVHFICVQGQQISELVKKAAEVNERVNSPVEAYAVVPSISCEEVVAKFTLTLSLKKNQPKT